MKIVTAAEMRRIEAGCAPLGLPAPLLMEKAGLAFARAVQDMICGVSGREVLVLVGPGNNGGDGLVAARHLARWGAQVRLYFLKTRPESDRNWQMCQEYGLTSVEVSRDRDLCLLRDWLETVDVVIDAILGTGNSRPLAGDIAAVLTAVQEVQSTQHFRIIALDLPSGLDADSGSVDPFCLTVNDTVTLGLPKTGLFNMPGMVKAGKITVVDIGIPEGLTSGIKKELLTAEDTRSRLPERPFQANKGTFGKTLVVGGSENYIGAVYLAASGALRVGAGLVTVSVCRSLLPLLASRLTEATYLSLPETAPGCPAPGAAQVICRETHRYNALLIGCGLGQSPAAEQFIASLREYGFSRLPGLVLDADALNLLSRVPEWWHGLKGAVLTPHPGEMARLTRLPLEDIQADRVETARRFALEWNNVVILKGAYTVIASPDGSCRVSQFANPGLATAGTGDVLAGTVAGLLAQGMGPYEAASLAVYLHGAAGEMVRRKSGDTGMLAGDLITALPEVIKQLKGGTPARAVACY